MGELGDLLELLHGAGAFRSVRAEYRLWSHSGLVHKAFVRAARGKVVAVEAHAGADDSRQTSERLARIWLERPDQIRVEREGDHGQGVAVRRGELWWMWTPQMGARTNERADRQVGTTVAGELLPLLDPAPLTGRLDWQPCGHGERAGRSIVSAVARPREALREQRHPDFELHALGHGADEYLLDVESEVGVILRSEARIDGEPFMVIEAISIAFDETFPDETFVFELPEGEEFEALDLSGHEIDVPVHELVRRVGFTIFVPGRVPPRWEFSTTYTARNERVHRAEAIGLSYRSIDGTTSLHLSQSRTGDDLDEHRFMLRDARWENIERDGLRMKIRRRAPDWRQPQLHLERDGTSIFLHSSDLSDDELIEFALGLKPASGRSPLSEG
jgi:outer membrane lipoprotein-sorting protein